MVYIGVKWCLKTETWKECSGELKVVAGPLLLTLAVALPSPKQLVCYCTSRVGTASSKTWVAVFGDDKAPGPPYHGAGFPFPFFLPIYPSQDLYFVSYTTLESTSAADVPFSLCALHATADVDFLPLKLSAWKAWRESMGPCGAAHAQVNVYETLQSAFDFLWNPAEVCSGDDFFADEDVETDLQLIKQPVTDAGGGVMDAGTPSLTAENKEKSKDVHLLHVHGVETNVDSSDEEYDDGNENQDGAGASDEEDGDGEDEGDDIYDEDDGDDEDDDGDGDGDENGDGDDEEDDEDDEDEDKEKEDMDMDEDGDDNGDGEDDAQKMDSVAVDYEDDQEGDALSAALSVTSKKTKTNTTTRATPNGRSRVAPKAVSKAVSKATPKAVSKAVSKAAPKAVSRAMPASLKTSFF